MLANNPFIVITSSGHEKVVDRVKEKVELQMQINEALKNGKIVVLKGSPGVGKSTLVNLIVNNLKKSQNVSVIREDFTPSVYNKLRSLNLGVIKKTLVILDDFNNVELLDKNSQEKVIKLMSELAEKAALLLIENRTEGVEKDFRRMHIEAVKFDITGLQRTDLRQLLTDRLNMVRDVPRDNIDPFTDDEFEKIYRKSGGNPRIALLICAALFDQKETSLI
jgi:replication-associated recombination protein RarA